MSQRSGLLFRMIVHAHFVALLVLYTNGVCRGQDALATAMEQIVTDRTRAEAYVKLVDQHYDRQARQYVEAQKLYTTAAATYSGWVSSTRIAILNDSIGALVKGPGYQATCKAAAEAAARFQDYVQKLPLGPETKSIVPILTMLAVAGRHIANAVLDVRKNYLAGARQKVEIDEISFRLRRQLADEFESRAQWRDWATIVTSK
jgi:hypothetical protein